MDLTRLLVVLERFSSAAIRRFVLRLEVELLARVGRRQFLLGLASSSEASRTAWNSSYRG